MCSTNDRLGEPSVTALGRNPHHRTHNINGNAFQQDAITSHYGWQYAVFYAPIDAVSREPLFVHVSRRKLPRGPWETVVFEDYAQTVDDGHNTVQLGICPGDGTIHLSFDHHCDVLHYKHSVVGLASSPNSFSWTSAHFTNTKSSLPGLSSGLDLFDYITYPRFGTMGNDMFFSFRTGKAGLGDDHLYIYRADGTGFTFAGTHLKGIDSNPYVHGLDWCRGRLHVTWVYRGFVWYEGWDDLSDTKHKMQAGPNGAENNHDICYAYSDDKGCTWKNGDDALIASLCTGEGVSNQSSGIVAFEIPKGSGLTNQEAQAVDEDGGVHVLNRVRNSCGKLLWKHFYRRPEGHWTVNDVVEANGSKRGRLAVTQAGDLLAILPDSQAPIFRIMRARKSDHYRYFREIWTGGGLSGEPLVDKVRLKEENVLSILACKGNSPCCNTTVAVLDFIV